MLVFIRAIEAFEVPALVGLPGRISVLTTDIYGNMVAKAPPDIGGASALSVLMLVLVLVLLAIYGRLSRHAERFATVTGKGFRPRPFDLGRLRYATAGMLVLNFLLLLAVPTAMLAWVSLLPFYQPVSFAALSRVTLDNYRIVFSADHVGLIANTLLVAVATATLAVALTFLAAWLAVRRAPGGWALERLATIPLVFPGLILGIRGDAALSAFADPAVRHAGNPDLGVRHQLSALWNALQRRRHAADPSRARGVGGDVRRLSLDAPAPHRCAAARAGLARGLVVHFPDGRAGVVARDPAVGSALADHGRDAVRSLDQRAGHRACGARIDMVHADGDDRRDILPSGTPLRRERARSNVNAALHTSAIETTQGDTP
jgi:ABC-type spermidine/putrescine transport system permease subunit II